MSDSKSDPIVTVTKARSQIARLYMGGDPDPDRLREARARMACAKIDRAVRESMGEAATHLNHVQASHLIGLLLGAAGVKYDAATLIEGIVRHAVADAQSTEA